MKSLIIITSCVLSILFFNSCRAYPNETNTVKSSVDQISRELKGLYLIDSLDGISTSIELTIEFNSNTNQVSGFSGCNTYFGNFTVNKKSLSLGQLASTKKLCQKENNDIESRMLSLLAEVDAYEFKNNRLYLKNGNTVLLVSKIMTKGAQRSVYNKISYITNTRGFYEKIWIESGQLHFTNDRVAKTVVSNSIPKKEKEALSNLTKEIEVEKLSSMEPPSKDFQHDRVAIATLQIETESGIYKTSSFDHGNPPLPIKDLVEKILSIKESMVE